MTPFGSAYRDPVLVTPERTFMSERDLRRRDGIVAGGLDGMGI
jgi:hypothetical protein